VPVKYQVLWDSVVSFLWQVVLSLFESKSANPFGDYSPASGEIMGILKAMMSQYQRAVFLSIPMLEHRAAVIR